MSTRLRLPFVVLLLLTLIACGRGGANPAGSTVVVTPSSISVPTATSLPATAPMQTPTPTTASTAPTGIERLSDPTGDVTDSQLTPVSDAPPFVDLTAVSLAINATDLVLTIETAGTIPQTLDPGEEMSWALELEPADPASLTLYRITVTLSGNTWSTTNFDFESGHWRTPATVNTHENELRLSISLTELPKIDGPFRWWVAALWGHLGASGMCGDRTPDGDPVWFPENARPVAVTWEEIPQKSAPADLGRVRLPTDDAGVTAVLARMPDEIVGMPHSPENVQGQTGLWHITYGVENETSSASMSLVALDTAAPKSGWPADITGRDIIELFISGNDLIDDAGRDGDLGWVRLHVDESLAGGATEASQSIVWADADSHWYFGASADTTDHLDALLTAFVAAARAGD